MDIAGFRKTSLIDYPGQIAAVVFTQGCNFRCPYCHNPELIEFTSDKEFMDPDFLWDFLKQRNELLDGVVITGGEPTLQEDIIDFIKKIRSRGLKVKLDTNGSVFRVMETIVRDNLVDYVALDIKGAFADYPEIAGIKNPDHIDNVRQSMQLLVSSDITCELRTTVVPGYHDSAQIEKIAGQISGSGRYVLQNFRPGKTLDPDLQEKSRFSEEKIYSFQEKVQKRTTNLEVEVKD